MDPNVLHNIGYGMYIVSASKDGKFNAQIANTVFQITSNPITVAISINKNNLTFEYIKSAQRFSISILGEDTPVSFIGKFGFKSGRDEDKFKDTKFKVLNSGCPVVIDYALGFIEAKVTKEVDFGTHVLFVGEMEESAILKLGRTMTYDYYHQVKRGTTPKSAPTFIQSEMEKPVVSGFSKYRCSVCGYVYDPEVGDPDSGIAPGTSFDDLPNNWVCPICGVGKDKFVKEG